jgi:hypothetical protein
VQATALPKPPLTISGTLQSAYGDTVCADQEIVQPTNTIEVAAAIKKYYDMSKKNPGSVKIRVVTRSRGFPASDGYRYPSDEQQ